MAYPTLLSLEKIIDQTLNDDRISISPHEAKQIISLDKYVISFHAFLENFPEKAKILEARIRDVAVQAENIIEWFSWKQIKNSYRYFKHISILRGIMLEYELHKIRDQMDSIAAEMLEIQNSIKVKDEEVGESIGASSPSKVATTGKTTMVGFNKDFEEIRDKLCGSESGLQYLPIFGMGGIGKTTLARNAYDDQLIVEHFPIRVWITISQDYSAERILVQLLDYTKEFNPQSMTENSEDSQHGYESLQRIPDQSIGEMEVKVYKILACKRFLIVMDDIWSPKVLDDVRNIFPDCGNRSRIMLTTRLTEIATYANSILPHAMSLMDADQSWNLLCEKVLVHHDCIPPELESTGREIARSCCGLPLAIVVIAGILSTVSKTQNSWKEVATNIKSSLATTDGQIEKILSLSYNHLPQRLRPCFLYMGGFPEDHEIKVTDLIRLWIAESFVERVRHKEFEITAEEYLEDLVGRSLLMVKKRKSSGRTKSVSIHDMVREMCIKLSEEERFLVHASNGQASTLLNQRRLSISSSDLSSSNINSSDIRTIIYFQRVFGSLSLRGFRLLRVLDVLRVRREIPCQFFELFHLRYLAFRIFHYVPTTISHLQCLETLIIHGNKFKELPHEIWHMRQLRHLIVSNYSLPKAPRNASALENLQRLGKVQNLDLSIARRDLVPKLKKLLLTYYMVPGELNFRNLQHFRHLENLHLELERGGLFHGESKLVVPSSLKKLTLIGWGHHKSYLNIGGPFPNLEVLKLKRFNFVTRVWRTSVKDFPQLKFLLIEESDIMQWETESSHFPRLKTLLIHSCLDLTKIPECIGEFPTLELIELELCTDSLVECAEGIREEALDYGDDVFQVRCIKCKPYEELLPPPVRREKRRQPRGHSTADYLRQRYLK